MKRYFSLFIALLLCAAMPLSLTSCFTSSVTYTEWELSDDELSITDGNEVYKLYSDAEFTEYWSPSGYSCLYYQNEVYSKWQTYANITAALTEKGVLALDIYEDDWLGGHVGTQLYANEAGKRALDAIESTELSTECYALDYNKYTMGKLSAELVAMISALDEEKLVEKNYGEIYSLDSITVSAMALEGFLFHDFGVFYFDRTEIYYRDYTMSEKSSVGTFDVYRLSDTDRAVLSAFLDGGMIENISTLGSEWETGVIDDTANERSKLISKIILLCTVFILCIFAPALPLALSLILVAKRKWRFAATDYMLFISSAVWLLAGFAAFIILLF